MSISYLYLDVGIVIEIFSEMIYNVPDENNSYFEFSIFGVDYIRLFVGLVVFSVRENFVYLFSF